MHRDKMMTNGIKIAATKLLGTIPSLRHLPEIWKVGLIRGNSFPRKSRNCVCSSDESQVSSFPTLYGVWLSPTQSNEKSHQWQFLPYAYVAWVTGSRSMPIIEIMEIPLFHSPVFPAEHSRTEMDRTLAPEGRTFLISPLKNADLSQTVRLARRKVFRYFYEISGKEKNFFHFSILTHISHISSQSVDSSADDLKIIVKWEHDNTSDFHSVRQAPVVHANHLFVLQFDCWMIMKEYGMEQE